MLILSAAGVACRCRRGGRGRRCRAAVVAVVPALAAAVVVVVGLAVVEVVVDVDFGAWAAVTSNSAVFTLSLMACCCVCGELVEVRLHVERLLAAAPEQLDRRVDQAGAAEGVGRLRLGHARRRDGPLGPALELDPEVQPAPQHDRDDPQDDDGRRDAEPDLAPADEVETGLAPVEAGDGPVPLGSLGQQRPGGVVEADQLLLVQAARCRRSPRSASTSSSGTSSSELPSPFPLPLPPPRPLSLTSHRLRRHRRRPGGPAPAPAHLRLRTGAEARGDAEGPRALQPRALTHEDDEGPCVEPGDRHVHDGGEAEEEGEALHVPDGDQVEDDRRQQRDEVSGPHRAPGALEAPVDGRPHRAAGSGLVLQSFEVDDVRVDGDTDRHDEAGDAGEVEARCHRCMARAPR